MVELGGQGSVINGPTPSSFLWSYNWMAAVMIYVQVKIRIIERNADKWKYRSNILTFLSPLLSLSPTTPPLPLARPLIAPHGSFRLPPLHAPEQSGNNDHDYNGLLYIR